MKKSKFDDAQVAAALRACASGTPIGEVARKLGVSEHTLYVWTREFASLDSGEIGKLRQLKEENSKLKRLVTDLTLDKTMLQELLSRK